MARAPTSYNQCLTAVETAAGRELKQDELERIFDKLQGRVRRYTAGGLSETDAYVRAGKELGDEMRLQGVIAKRNQLINVARRRELEGRLREGSEAADLRALITGREGTAAKGGVANSTDAKVHGLSAQVLGPFVAELRQVPGLVKVLARGDKVFDRDVIRELWSIESGGKPATKNVLARQAAEIINRAQENVRLLQNDAGAWIGKLDHYVTRQSHDMDKVRGTLKDANGKWDAEANFRAWRDAILPRLDERTFDSLDEITPVKVDGFLRGVWKGLATGVHDRATGAAWGEVGAGTGPANLARRVSQERKLLFKDADAWADYNDQFGKGSLFDSVRSGLETGARNTALMRDWGPNPEAMYKTVVNAAKERAADRADVAAVDALNSTWNDRIFDVVTGKAAIPAGATAAKITAVATALQTLTKLGGVVLSSIPDLANTAATLRHNGVPLFESYGNQLASLLPKSAARKEAAAMAGVGIDGVLGNIASRYTAVDGMRGTAAKLVDTFHKWNGLEWWTESMKFGVGSILTHNLGRLSSQSFDSLPGALKVTLGRYGIDAAQWDVARTATRTVEGKAMLLPAHIDDAKVRSAFQTYVSDQVREAMNEPDAYARTLATWGTQAGTAAGAAVRILMQFKSYPITFMRRTLNRELNRNDGIDVAGMAHLVVGTTLLGYAAMEMKNLARGRDPRTANADKPGDWAKIVAAAMVQGGGLGLYGDFLFGDSSRMGAGPVLSLAGPTAGTLDDVAQEVQQLRKWLAEGDARAGKDARTGALRLLQNNTPFVNMFYTRALMDHLIWHRLQEAMNPGYLRRYEERMKREQDTTFWLRPSDSPYR